MQVPSCTDNVVLRDCAAGTWFLTLRPVLRALGSCCRLAALGSKLLALGSWLLALGSVLWVLCSSLLAVVAVL